MPFLVSDYFALFSNIWVFKVCKFGVSWFIIREEMTSRGVILKMELGTAEQCGLLGFSPASNFLVVSFLILDIF